MERFRRGGGVTCFVKNSIWYNQKLNFYINTEGIFIEILLTIYQPVLVNFLCRPPDKHDFVYCLEWTFDDGNVFEIQECYLLCDININLQLKNRSTHQRSSLKKVFLKISQNSLENTCARVSFLIRLQSSGLQLIKKEALAQVFSCEFCKILRTRLLQNTTGRLLS